MRWSLCVLLLASLGHVATIRADDRDPAEADRLEGHWKVVALEADGRKATDAELDAMKGGGWSFRGNEVTFKDPRTPGVTSSFTLDPGKSPKEMDVTSLDGPQKGTVLEAIYKLEEGRLTICLRALESAEKGRPTEFSTQAGSGLGLIVLERAEP